MKTFVYIAASLDGYIATPDHGLKWLMDVPNPDSLDYGFSEFIGGIDAIIMGRNTYEVVTQFEGWPYKKPVFVMSGALTKVPEHLVGKMEIVGGDIEGILKELSWEGYHNLYIDGGKLIQSFLMEDLIDEMIITRIPVLLGGGIPLFGSLDGHMKWTHVNTEVFSNSLVKSTYERER